MKDRVASVIKGAWQSLCGTGVSPVRALAVAVAVALGCGSASAGYTPVQWIKASGKQWIYTGYKPACTDKVEIKVNFSTVDASQCLYCSRGTTTTKDTFTGFLIKDSKKIRFDRNASTSASSSMVLKPEVDYVLVADGNSLACTVNGTQAATMASGTFTPGSAFSLFASHTAGTALSASSSMDNWGSYTLYSFRVYDKDGNIVRQYIPVRDDSAAPGTAQYGLYETVTKTFCPGLGSGSFTAGPEGGWRINPDTQRVECLMTISVIGGTVALPGGAPTKKIESWFELGSDASFTVSCPSGTSILKWIGGSPSAGAGAGEFTVRADVMTLTAMVGAELKEWAGTGDGRDWFDAANWNPSGVPQVAAVVTIPAKSDVVVTSTTPELVALDIAGTLMSSNWFTAVRADTVTIASGGKLTCGVAFKTTEMSNRVWVICRALDIQKGGAIDVDMRGYYRNNGPGTFTQYKVGGNAGAGVHGGYGAVSHPYNHVLPIDSVSEPSQPGSGGNTSQWSYYNGSGDASLSALEGGGAVRIEASESVTVNGSILAGGKTTYAVGGTYGAAGAGGSIWIDTKRFYGNGGKLSACGCSPRYPRINVFNSSNGGAGGGGRIAIHYDTEAQRADDAVDMTFDVCYGWARQETTTFYNYDEYWLNADVGTLWFSDAKLLGSLGRSVFGEIHFGDGTSALELDNLSVTAGFIRFGQPGMKIKVKGDLSISGNQSKLDLGGDMQKDDWEGVFHYSALPCRLEVGGDLTVGDYGRLDVHAAATNGTDEAGAYVDVGGEFRVKTNGWVYVWSDPKNGGSAKFDVGSAVVDLGGRITANDRGFSGGYRKPTVHGNGFGPGYAASDKGFYVGAGHGGYGASATNVGCKAGQKYDNEYHPTLAGSGGYNAGWSSMSQGGGVVYIKAKYDVLVDGKITAAATRTPDEGRCAAGAGGTILIDCRAFGGADTGLLDVHGANTISTGNKPGAGAGGCIAVWTGDGWSEKVRISRCTKSTEPFAYRDMLYLGQTNVDGGVCPDADVRNGDDGTCWFINYTTPGFKLIVR